MLSRSGDASVWPECAIAASGVLKERSFGAYGASYKLAAAVRTNVAKARFRTACAKRALEAANHRDACIRRQIPIAAFTVGLQDEHRV
jgi:hypothetical protein